MSYKLSTLLFGFLMVFVLNSCWWRETIDPFEPEAAYRPVYLSEAVQTNVVQEAARTMENPGKIYIYGPYLLVNEIQKGIHIIDNRDPSQPQPLSFLKIPGNVDMAIRNNILYADNHRDLIALDMHNLNEIKLIKRVKQAFPSVDYFPPEFNVVYECVDPQKGEVSHWERLPVAAADDFQSKCYY
ncbi:MAG: hypothetical protein AAFU64_09230 [Bacteroidota bacterium]